MCACIIEYCCVLVASVAHKHTQREFGKVPSYDTSQQCGQVTTPFIQSFITVRLMSVICVFELLSLAYSCHCVTHARSLDVMWARKQEATTQQNQRFPVL